MPRLTVDDLPPVWAVGRTAQEAVIAQIEPPERGPGTYWIAPDGSRRVAWCRPRGKARVKKYKRLRHRGLTVSRMPIGQ